MPILSNAAVLVNPPAPPARPYGLFSVVEPQPLPRIEASVGGIEYQPDTCGVVRLWASECESITAKVFDAGVDTVTADPFMTYASWDCGSIGYTLDEVRERLLTRLTLHEQKAVESRLWQGATGQGIDGLFADAISLGSASCPVEGVRMLEQALADNGIAGGMVHARSGMSAILSRDYLVFGERTGRLTTPLGTPYVFGQGYDGTGPAGQAPSSTTEWMYASGRVVVWRGSDIDIVTREVLNRSTNQQYGLIERPYLMAVECGIWAVNITHGC
jgi:hypothetical protein